MEDGGVRLSYTNGIGGPPQLHGATETASSASANKTAKTEPSSLSLPMPDGATSLAGLDDAKLSTTAGVVAQALLGSDVRTDKVAALQQSIAAGTYSVSSSNVADKLMGALLK